MQILNLTVSAQGNFCRLIQFISITCCHRYNMHDLAMLRGKNEHQSMKSQRIDPWQLFQRTHYSDAIVKKIKMHSLQLMKCCVRPCDVQSMSSIVLKNILYSSMSIFSSISSLTYILNSYVAAILYISWRLNLHTKY